MHTSPWSIIRDKLWIPRFLRFGEPDIADPSTILYFHTHFCLELGFDFDPDLDLDFDLGFVLPSNPRLREQGEMAREKDRGGKQEEAR